ncbi:peptidylprolyl isomerase [Thiohalomonas denitrificans]|uniref:Chaperone SurA n=1 Tax=Thiohalomonas denitrificans TaxID=415747 RepID=A0A1G5QAB1_9GAMM|nr:periplasmic chaperone for outer membrane proteins SurA [Thiohalomonas denitrificans]
MKTAIATLLTATLTALLLAASPASAAPRVVELDRIVAVANDNVVTLKELEQRMKTIKLQLEQSSRGELPPDDVLRPQVLERLIIERLQLDRALESGIRVEDEEVNRTISRIAADSNLSLQEFRDVLTQDGINFAGFREEIRNEMIITRLRSREVENRVQVSDAEVEHFLESRKGSDVKRVQYRLSHILIAVPEAASPEQVREGRKEAEAILAQARSGADFRELAIAHSDGRQALEGGDLGWRGREELPTLFADAVSGMETGEVADPIRSPSGFHLIRLEATRGQAEHLVQQSHARHILISTNELVSDENARTRLERLRERIQAGEDFAALARTHSDDKGSARSGGDLGWSNPGSFVPAFEQVLDGLSPGEISRPFKSDFGWHIVQLIERRDHDNTEAYNRNRAHQALRERKAEEELQSWLRRLRDEAYVDIRLEG